MQKAFVLDINKCTGCHACQVACQIENQLDPGRSWRWVDTFNVVHHPDAPVFHLSLACNHCADAPCMSHCPALAYSQDTATGAVLLVESSCIGCRYCTWACPYDAPSFEPAAGVVTKCTFCNDRLQSGQNPACVDQCPTGALQLTERGAPIGDAEIAGFPATDARPSIRFVPLRDGQDQPAMTAPTPSTAPTRPVASKISLRSEWPLVVFSLLTALLTGLMAVPVDPPRLSPFVFVLVASIAAGFSTVHLGRKLRAYRAVLNWRRSWLSREIVLFSAFVALSTVHLALPSSTIATWLPAVLLGVATLFAIDSVYDVTRTPGLRSHSAQVLLTGLLVLTMAAGVGPVFAAVVLLKSALYVRRKLRFSKSGKPSRPAVSVLRVGVGALVPAAMWLGGDGQAEAPHLIVALTVLGEVIDRCEFYTELDVPSPRRQMALDLRKALAATQKEAPIR